MRTRHAILSLLPLLLVLVPARAEQLPIRTYTTTDGLARDHVQRIVQDSRGFIWFCTIEGLSRFDGYSFNNYGTAQGLPHRIVSDLVETHGGDYFVATGAGFALFDPEALTRRDAEGRPAPGRLFTVIPFPAGSRAKEAYLAYEDGEGRVWCGTDRGLYRLAGGPGSWRLEPSGFLSDEVEDRNFVAEMIHDARGTLWITTPAGLVRRNAAGRVTLFAKGDGFEHNPTTTVVIDAREHLWVGTPNGLYEFESAPAEGPLKRVRIYRKEDGLPGVDIKALAVTPEGELWVGMFGGLARFAPSEGGGAQFVAYTPAEGLNDQIIVALHVDDAGNLWVGGESGGAMKVARSGILSYGPADGLRNARIAGFIHDAAGRFLVLSGGEKDAVIFSIAEQRGFEQRVVQLPPNVYNTWGWYQLTVEDREGDWWVPTMSGVLRYDADFRLRHVYKGSEGPCPDYVFRAFEDSHGDIWFGSLGAPGCVLSRWERATNRFVRYSPADGLSEKAPTAFAEDGAGNLWIGLYGGGLVRRRGERFERFTPAEGVPVEFVRGLFLDRERRLWVGTSGGGVARVDDPEAERPHFKTYTTREGLTSDQVTCITEDLRGRIYLGTGRGLDRLDVEAGRFRHYTTADGLASNFVNVCTHDREGSVWLGTLRGLSRLTPLAERAREAPPVLVTALRVGGEPFPVSETGARTLSGLTLEAGRNQLQVDFVGLDYVAGNVLRYQYKLEGADADWSAPSVQRSVNFANLSPGSYRFLVRALDGDGAASSVPAVVSFRALPPFWRRWWFVALCVLVLAAAGFAAERMFAARRRERARAEGELRRAKEERLAELERVRKRIATDLHDDIGSSLTQIAVLSEVARQGTGGAGAEQLAQISAVSNELVESMSDIVWAINPKKDRLSDLTQRMRRFASDVFTARGVRLHFDAPLTPAADGDIRLGADLRREVFLVFKESVNNVVKHSGASRAEVEFRLEGGLLLLRIADDGRGFDASGADRSGEYERRVGGAGGNGLYSLFKRAREMGGEYEVRSAPGAGTTVSLRVPVGPARRGDGGDDHYPNGW